MLETLNTSRNERKINRSTQASPHNRPQVPDAEVNLFRTLFTKLSSVQQPHPGEPALFGQSVSHLHQTRLSVACLIWFLSNAPSWKWDCRALEKKAPTSVSGPEWESRTAFAGGSRGLPAVSGEATAWLSDIDQWESSSPTAFLLEFGLACRG